jgi:hypothetical protein
MLLIARTASITVAFPGAFFTYAEGALHSSDDAPAFAVSTAGNKKHEGMFATVVSKSGSTYRVSWWWASLGWINAPICIDEERRWYDKGELHRDFGPAVHGRGFLAGTYYWHKYNRGALGGGELNTFENGEARFGCAPGVQICSLTRYADRKVWLVDPGSVNWVTLRIYLNDAVRVVQMNAVVARAPNVTIHSSTPRPPDPLDDAVLVKLKCNECDTETG